MTDHLHITTDSDDQITGTKTFATAPVAGGTDPSLMFLDAILDPTILRIRKVSGDLEIVDELSSTILVKLLSVVDPESIDIINTTGTGDTYALVDHVHQGLHSLTVGTPLYGDIIFKALGASIATQAAQDILISLGYGVGSAIDIATSSNAGSGTDVSRADHIHRGVRSISTTGQPEIVGDSTFSEGTNITLTQVGNTITIDSTGVPGSLLALGVLPVVNGGTGLGNYTIGDLLVATGATTLSRIADVAQGNLLLTGGVGVIPFYGKANLSNHTIGTIPLAAITPGIVGQALLTLTGSIVGWGTLDLANTSGALPLARLQDDPVADRVLLPGGPSADPHWGTLDITSLTGAIALSQIPDGPIAGQCLIGQGVGADPIWGPVGINTGTIGLLTVAKGGTAQNHLVGYLNGMWANSAVSEINKSNWVDGNGATLIGVTGGLPQGKVLTAGTGISITNAANSITIARTGGAGDPAYSNTSCYLVYAAPDIALKSDEGKGSFLDIDGIPRFIPNRGELNYITLTPSGLLPETTYFIYAYWTGSIIALEASATGASLNNGVANKTGDSTRRLVGMARTTSTTTWIDVDQGEPRGYVLSYFNRRKKVARVVLGDLGNVSTTSPFGGTKWFRLKEDVLLTTLPRFLSWGYYLSDGSAAARLPEPVVYKLHTGIYSIGTAIMGIELGFANSTGGFVQAVALPSAVLSNTVRATNVAVGRLRNLSLAASLNQIGTLAPAAGFNDPTTLKTAVGVVQTLGSTVGIGTGSAYVFEIEYYG